MKAFKWRLSCKQGSLMQEFHTVFLCFKRQDSSWAHVILIRVQGIRYSRSDLIPWRAFSRTDSLILAVLKLTAISSPLVIVLFLLIRQNTPNPDRVKEQRRDTSTDRSPRQRQTSVTHGQSVWCGESLNPIFQTLDLALELLFFLRVLLQLHLSLFQILTKLEQLLEKRHKGKSTTLKTHNERRAL